MTQRAGRCPIPGCPKIFKIGHSGIDAHVNGVHGDLFAGTTKQAKYAEFQRQYPRPWPYGPGDAPKFTEEEAPAEEPLDWSARDGTRAVGLDWSGGQDAGGKIWQAHLSAEDGSIRLVRLDQPFLRKPDPSSVRAAFAAWFSATKADVFGFDFCFGLHRSHLPRVCAAAGVATPPTMTPSQLGAVLAKGFPTPSSLRTACQPELKRETDRAAGSAFAPTNLRMFRQTWLGLMCLATLPEPVIAPWKVKPGPVIVEVLPAKVARSLGSNGGYKGPSPTAAETRTTLVAKLEDKVHIHPRHQGVMIADMEGDAIDAVLAGLAALRAHQQGFPAPPRPVLDEGWIY